MAILSRIYANETSGVLVTSVFAGFAVLALWMVADYFASHHASDQGLRTAIDPASLPVLEETTAGSPPSLWA